MKITNHKSQITNKYQITKYKIIECFEFLDLKNWNLFGIWNLVIGIYIKQGGQALVTLLFFMLIGITVTSAAIAVLITNAFGTSYSDQGTESYYIAESGAEDAVLKLLKDPSYTTTGGGYAMSLGGGSATIQIANGIATSTGTLANTSRKIQVKTVYNNNILNISSWKEIQ